MLTTITGPMLAEAFPVESQPEATRAGNAAARLLAPRQWTERLPVQLDVQRVLIPARLHFPSEKLALKESDPAWPFARACRPEATMGLSASAPLPICLQICRRGVLPLS